MASQKADRLIKGANTFLKGTFGTVLPLDLENSLIELIDGTYDPKANPVEPPREPMSAPVPERTK